MFRVIAVEPIAPKRSSTATLQTLTSIDGHPEPACNLPRRSRMCNLIVVDLSNHLKVQSPFELLSRLCANCCVAGLAKIVSKLIPLLGVMNDWIDMF